MRFPCVVFDDEKFRLRVREQLNLLVRGELVIHRNENAAAEENRVRGNQPLRLIGHDDRRARAVREAGVLQRARQRQRRFLELAIRETGVFAVAIRFDQAEFVRPAVERRREALLPDN